MSIVVANGLLVKEAYYLYSDLVTDNPVVPNGVSIYSYDSIDGNGAYVGLKVYLGSDVPFLDLIPFPPPSVGAKVPKAFTGADMPADSEFQYVLTSGDITALGQTIQVTGVLVNGENWPATWVFSGTQGALVAGDTIDFTGLPLIADVSTITFNLS